MKIAVLNEFSQASKNDIIVNELKKAVEPMGHQVFNAAMACPLSSEDVPEAYTEENPRLTYLHLGIQAALLLNSGAADFVITGCGTGQGALVSLNMYPGVVCGYCIEPTDAYLFLQINNGNALSLPYAKGFGWGAELNLNNIFSRAFGSPKGMGCKGCQTAFRGAAYSGCAACKGMYDSAFSGLFLCRLQRCRVKEICRWDCESKIKMAAGNGNKK